MSALYRKIELLTNLAIIVVAVLIGTLFVRKYLVSGDVRAAPQVTAGTKVSLPDIDWGKNKQTLLLVLSKGCHFCSESASFYQRLVHEKQEHGDFQIIAVLPQSPSDSKEYLSKLSVSVDDIRQAPLKSIGIKGTPTLISVNNAGVVINSWTGKLSDDKESEVLAQLPAN